MLPPVASLNQAIIENEANSVVRQRTLTTWAKVEKFISVPEKNICITPVKTAGDDAMLMFVLSTKMLLSSGGGVLGTWKVCQWPTQPNSSDAKCKWVIPYRLFESLPVHVTDFLKNKFMLKHKKV